MKSLISVPKPTPNYFARACFAVAQGKVRGNQPDLHIRKDDTVTRAILDRGAVAPGSTTSVNYGDNLAQDALKNFLLSLAPYSGGARLIAQALSATVNAIEETRYPVRAAGAVPPAFVAENGAIPVRSSDFDLVTIGPSRKMAHILAWSRELSKRSDAEAIFDQMLREDVSAGVDAAFFATSAASSSAPAGLLNGASTTSGYGGGDRAAMEQDLIWLSNAVAVSGNVTFVVSAKRLNRLRILAPELAAQLDIAPSAAVPEDRVVAADAASLIVAVDPEPDIQMSEGGLIHMSDGPLPISDGGTADPVRSLWQTATVAARVIHDLTFAKRRSDAVAYVDGATW